MLPGLVDSHVHLSEDPYTLTIDELYRSESFESTYLRFKRNALEAMNSGITTLCDLGGKNMDNYYLSQKLSSEYPFAPHIISSGCFFSKRHGHYMSRGGFVINSREEAEYYATYLLKLNITIAKIMLGNYEYDSAAVLDLAEKTEEERASILPPGGHL